MLGSSQLPVAPPTCDPAPSSGSAGTCTRVAYPHTHTHMHVNKSKLIFKQSEKSLNLTYMFKTGEIVHIWPYHVLLLYTLKLTVCLLFYNTHNKQDLQSHRTMESKRLASYPFPFKYSVVIVNSNLGLKHRIARSVETKDIDSVYVNLKKSSAKTHSENEWRGVVNTGNPWENCSSPYYLCKWCSVQGCKR